MALIRILISLILWFPASLLVVWVVSILVESIHFSWIWVTVIAFLTAWIFEYITGPKGH